MHPDVMDRLVVSATEQQMDLKEIFAYPLPPLLFSMASPDGYVLKTDNLLLKTPWKQKRTIKSTRNHQTGRRKQPVTSSMDSFCCMFCHLIYSAYLEN